MKFLTPIKRQYKVQKGDTLIGIARRNYHDGRYWQQIAAANPGHRSKIFAGKILTLPTIPIPEPTPHGNLVHNNLPSTGVPHIQPTIFPPAHEETGIAACTVNFANRVLVSTASEPAPALKLTVKATTTEKKFNVPLGSAGSVEIKIGFEVRVSTPDKPGKDKKGIHVESGEEVTYEDGKVPELTDEYQSGLDSAYASLRQITDFSVNGKTPKIAVGFSATLKDGKNDVFEMDVTMQVPRAVVCEVDWIQVNGKLASGHEFNGRWSVTFTFKFKRDFTLAVAALGIAAILAYFEVDVMILAAAIRLATGAVEFIEWLVITLGKFFPAPGVGAIGGEVFAY